MCPAEAVLKAEVLYRLRSCPGLSLPAVRRCSAPFEFKIAERQRIYSMPDPVPSEDSFKAQVSSGFEELPKVAASKSEASLGSMSLPRWRELRLHGLLWAGGALQPRVLRA